MPTDTQGKSRILWYNRKDYFACNYFAYPFLILTFLHFLTLLFPPLICFYNLPCCLPYLHLLNPPSSIKFMFIPPACFHSVSGSPRKYPKHRAPGREPQAGLVAAVGALIGICRLWRPCSSCTRSCVTPERYEERVWAEIQRRKEELGENQKVFFVFILWIIKRCICCNSKLLQQKVKSTCHVSFWTQPTFFPFYDRVRYYSGKGPAAISQLIWPVAHRWLPMHAYSMSTHKCTDDRNHTHM